MCITFCTAEGRECARITVLNYGVRQAWTSCLHIGSSNIYTCRVVSFGGWVIHRWFDYESLALVFKWQLQINMEQRQKINSYIRQIEISVAFSYHLDSSSDTSSFTAIQWVFCFLGGFIWLVSGFKIFVLLLLSNDF